jgi:hypothetical protein
VPPLLKYKIELRQLRIYGSIYVDSQHFPEICSFWCRFESSERERLEKKKVQVEKKKGNFFEKIPSFLGRGKSSPKRKLGQ